MRHTFKGLTRRGHTHGAYAETYTRSDFHTRNIHTGDIHLEFIHTGDIYTGHTHGAYTLGI